MCRTMTKAQWLSTRDVNRTPEVTRLAQSVFDGDPDAIGVLHDALVDAGHEALAEHFRNPQERHKGRCPGPGQCWALLLLLGRLPPDRELLGTPTASAWLGLTPAQFRRLVKRLQLEPDDEYANRHDKSGPPCPLWAPPTILALAPHEVDQARTPKRRRATTAP
jgi:hypothetical protein